MNNPTEGQPNHLKGPKTLAFTSSQHTKNKEPVSLLDSMCFKALDYLSEEAWGIAAFRKLQAASVKVSFPFTVLSDTPMLAMVTNSKRVFRRPQTTVCVS